MTRRGHNPRRARPARPPIALAVAVATVATILGAEGAARATATFVINNLDPAGVGFNESTPATPVGGNNGTTLGQQRMNVFRYATDTWGAALDSTVPIVIDARFAPLNCGAIITLGQAGATSAVRDIPGLPPDTFYPEPLAERILGRDLSRPAGSADIEATFNGDLKGCSAQLDWYYGLDGQSASRIDLAAVVLHELAHGLGFSSFVDLDTGAFEQEVIDVFSTHIYDNTINKSWPQMTDAERATSLSNVRHLVWNGANVMAATSRVLATGAPQLGVQPAVAGLVGNLGEMNFGPLVSAMGATGTLFLGSPVEGCSTLVSRPNSILILQGRASCSPLNQIANAEMAGAKGVLLTDSNDFSPPSSLELPPSQLGIIAIHIPVVGITLADANLLANRTGLTATLSAQSARLVGADEAGRPYLYASNPVRPGSSVSHWDMLARPHLLQEPESGYQNGHDITMEIALMRDIGWATSPNPDGGATGTGGVRTDAGATGTGGARTDAGATGTGGTIGPAGTGGATGPAGTGGATGPAGTGGASGATDAAADAATEPPGKSGCGKCSAGGEASRASDIFTLVVLTAPALIIARRRRTRRAPES